MIANETVRESLVRLGYRSSDVHYDYRFAAVDSPDHAVCTVQVAAFLDTPTSYKNAALALVQTTDQGDAAPLVAARRTLGAPYLIVISPNVASAWTYTASGPTRIQQVPVAQWEALLGGPKSPFAAQAVRQLKTIRLRVAGPAINSLFDPSVLYAIQAQSQTALDELLQAFLMHFDGTPRAGELSLALDYKALFPMVFRLLAAKILLDRQDRRVDKVDPDDALGVLDQVNRLYSLGPLALRWNEAKRGQVSRAWRGLRDGLFVRNIAADDLAFVYENTLITAEARRAFGTHSTPVSAAEYVVRSFELPDGPAAGSLRVYEPFAGSCVFLTAAMRRFRELLPQDWTPKQMHEHLVKHFRASELDPFACEIARLSLILADYPNHNGWQIDNEDLFAGQLLDARLQASDIVVCNPPFEDFDSPMDGLSIHKPLAVLESIAKVRPAYVGVVMPAGFSAHRRYRTVIDELVKAYRDVEILRLPEGAFRRASVGAEVFIAQRLRSNADNSHVNSMRSSVVTRDGWSSFAQSLRPTAHSTVEVDVRYTPALTGLNPLRDLWEELSHSRTFGTIAEAHRGLEWNGDQAKASRPSSAPGFRLGLHRIGETLAQFRIGDSTYLDCRPSKLRGGAIRLPWGEPKVICNAIRTSRGPWRLAAAVDTSGLVASQQFFGIWRREARNGDENLSLLTIACILNSPLANVFSYVHDPYKGLRIDTMERLPMPRRPMPSGLSELVREYVASIPSEGPLFESGKRKAAMILMEIDALVLAAYDLPPKMERELLRFIAGGERPCGHPFPNYPGIEPDAGAIPLGSRLAIRPEELARAWDALCAPLPAEVADVFDVA